MRVTLVNWVSFSCKGLVWRTCVADCIQAWGFARWVMRTEIGEAGVGRGIARI